MNNVRIDAGYPCRCQQAIDLILPQKGFIPEPPSQAEPCVFIPAKVVETAKFPSLDLTLEVPGDPVSDAGDILDGGRSAGYKRCSNPETLRI